MEDFLRPTGRESIKDKAIAHDLKGENLTNKQFERLVAKQKRFINCNFSYSHFDSVYLHKCTFDSCKFVGCKFINSNLRGSSFEGCTFDYAEFSHTQIEPEVLDKGCPGRENLQQKFARTLRVNFQQIGNAVAANKAIKIELEANRVHLYKAWHSREAYYRKHYPGLTRVKSFFEWAEFVLLDFCWGNGESLLKLLRTVAILIALIALGDVYFFKDITSINSYLEAMNEAPQMFVGVSSPTNYSGAILATIATLRYVMLACFVSILVKRFSRR